MKCFEPSAILKAEVFGEKYDEYLNYAKQFLGLLAKQAREEKEWDQEYLADELDIDIRTVRKIESGQGNIAYDLLTEIIHTLEICPQVLFYVDEADKGMKMDRLYRELLRLPLEDIKMVAESAYKVRRWLDSQTADSEEA